MNEFLRIAGDYSQWKVYRKAVIICDVTELFIRRAFAEKTRTIDQMRQAARSCNSFFQDLLDVAIDRGIGSEVPEGETSYLIIVEPEKVKLIDKCPAGLIFLCA